jgi:hypothetical protein
MFYVDPSSLPSAPKGKQYELWAIVDGQPVNAGIIITTKKGDRYSIQKMKTFGKVDAFCHINGTRKSYSSNKANYCGSNG